jgi:hypothetical protein
MLREGWILPGGSFALNEGPYYPPGSYYIGFTGVVGAVTSKIVPPNSNIPTMGSLVSGDGANGYVVSATLSP